MKVAILDYGAGNLHSLAKAVSAAGVEVQIESDPSVAIRADALLLPGVGAFTSATQSLSSHRGEIVAALSDGLPCLGICLGMQLLFDRSEEGPGEGLGVISGRVRRLDAVRIPQMGWNAIEERNDPLFDAAGLDTAYFANSYVCEPEDSDTAIAWTTHERDRFVAAVRSRAVVGVQFHPEKSSEAGCRFIWAFLDEVRS